MIRSASLRFAAVFGIVFALSALCLVAFLWFSTANLLDRQVEAAINADAQGLVERWSEGGIPALLLTIQERLGENVDDDAIYEVTDPLQRWVAGNLNKWPAKVEMPGVFYELQVVRAGARSLADVRRYDLPGGFRLLVGRDVRGRVDLRRLLTNALFSSMLVIAVLGAAGALVIRNVFRRMVAEVSATAEAIAGGDLTPRVRRSGRGDEFDRMAESINTMLERIARLMDGVRQVSNAIAHDLRTPITRARARLEDAALHAGSEAELRAGVERAVQDLDNVTAVFHALMRIAEIEVGARRSAFAEIDLGPMLADLAELYGAVAEEHGGLACAWRCPTRWPSWATATCCSRRWPTCSTTRSSSRRMAARSPWPPPAWTARCASRWPTRGRASRKPTGRAPPSASSAARRRAAPQGPAWAWRWCKP